MTYLPRSELTDFIIAELAQKILVGDVDHPVGGGWDDDPSLPGSSYIPYVVLTPMPISNMSGPVADPHVDYRVPFSLTFFGISRGQVDGYADLCRKHLSSITRQAIVLDGSTWKIQQIEPSSIGGITRTEIMEPSTFAQSDVITVWISKDL